MMFANRTFSILYLLTTGVCSVVCGEKITLVENHASVYRIVKPFAADSLEDRAAVALQSYLAQISGVTLSIVDDRQPFVSQSILIGHNSHLLRAGFDPESLNPGDDGFIIKSCGSTVILYAKSSQAVLYAVYAFLEDHLGCRMYAPDAIKIPRQEQLSFDEIDDRQAPFFTWRETLHYFPYTSQVYCDWHKLQNRRSSREKWGMWVHTFDRLVPAEKYFTQHPEYFSEINGIRYRDGQLCLTNPDVLNTVIENLRGMIKEKPDALYWSVSQNDNYNYCTCPTCRAQDEKHGSHSGSLLSFVNQVAASFPDKIISTLAYQYTRQAPQDLRPLKNVNIMFCSIECNRSKPLASDPGEAAFRRDLEDWGALTSNIIVWDYVVQFRNLLDPFPNLHVLQPNLQYFRDHNCRLMFQQGSGYNISEMHELRTYLIAKLLWNPDIDIEKVKRDFLEGYYGAAGRYIGDYLDLLHKSLIASDAKLDIYGYPFDAIHTYLTPELLSSYQTCFAQARKAVQKDSLLLARVERAELAVEFAVLDISLHDINSELAFVQQKAGKRIPNQGMLRRLEEFVQACSRHGIERLEEHGYSPLEFQKNILAMVAKATNPNKAHGKPVRLLTACSEKYPAGGGPALTDGKYGQVDYHYNWLGFENAHLEAVIDLQKETEIQEISADFLQHDLDWVFLPLVVEYAVSSDGKKFSKVGRLEHAVQPTGAKRFLHSFTQPLVGIKARYVKILAESVKLCPAWHRGSGQPAWIFIDEVIVR